MYLDFTDWGRLADQQVLRIHPPASLVQGSRVFSIIPDWFMWVLGHWLRRSSCFCVTTLLTELSSAPGPLLTALAFVFLWNIIQAAEIHRPNEQCGTRSERVPPDNWRQWFTNCLWYLSTQLSMVNLALFIVSQNVACGTLGGDHGRVGCGQYSSSSYSSRQIASISIFRGLKPSQIDTWQISLWILCILNIRIMK